jgi:hypothetical protein
MIELHDDEGKGPELSAYKYPINAPRFQTSSTSFLFSKQPSPDKDFDKSSKHQSFSLTILHTQILILQ